MLVIYGILVAGGLVILFLAGREKGKLPEKIGHFLYRKYACHKSGSRGGNQGRNQGGKQSAGTVSVYEERIGSCFFILWVCCILAFILHGSALLEKRDAGRMGIERNAYEEGSKEVCLRAFHGEEADDIRLIVEPRNYTVQELEILYEQFLPALEQCLLGENGSPDEVRSPLALAEYLDGFPFLVEWEYDAEGLIRPDGTLANETLDVQGKIVNLRARISYEEEMEREYELAVRILPPVYTAAEKFRMELEEAVKRAEADERSQTVFWLPERINGISVTWKETVEDKSAACILLGIAAAALFWKKEEEKQKNQVKEREKALQNAYPEFVTRMALMLGAGLTVRAAFRKVAEANEASVLTQEMRIACHEMDSGIPESQAYIRFGERCRLKQYRKLSALLTQNLKRGSKGILVQLEKEAHEALEEKKSNARALGEEAGTKLLLPMAGLLVVTMLLIMVPAYGNFGL